MDRDKLVRSVVINKERHWVYAAGWGRGWRVACTDERIARRDIKEVRARYIYCATCVQEMRDRL